MPTFYGANFEPRGWERRVAATDSQPEEGGSFDSWEFDSWEDEEPHELIAVFAEWFESKGVTWDDDDVAILPPNFAQLAVEAVEQELMEYEAELDPEEEFF